MRNRRARRRGRRITFGLVLLLAAGLVWYRWNLRPVAPADQAGTTLQIPTGASVRRIAELLREKNLIRSRTAFLAYAKIHRVGGTMKAGGFFLRPSLSTPEVVAILRRGYSEASVVTVPEGFTVADIDALLAGQGLTQPGEILACAQSCDFAAFAFLPAEPGLAARGGKVEGYLFPDTYFVVRDTMTPKSFLERMLGNFRTRVVEGLASELKQSGRTLHEAVTMSSLIEEETRTNEERPVVAGILWKRHANRIGLQVDAAVRYILEKPKGELTREDLDADSPYNLRKFRGLPPGPIASPGLASIQAALRPEDSPYFYYLHGADGMVRYAVTNEEHNENRRKYLH